MFAVIFEVAAKPSEQYSELRLAAAIRPLSEAIAGYISNTSYRSLTRPGWTLSLSIWADEEAVVRWRTQSDHQKAQARGRERLMSDYHLRVGQIMEDSQVVVSDSISEQRIDATQVGEGKTMVLLNAHQHSNADGKTSTPEEKARSLGLSLDDVDLVDWDIFEAVQTLGGVILLSSWRSDAAVRGIGKTAGRPEGARMRVVSIVRDYGMFDRREAPQYYPDAEGGETKHD